MPKTHDNHTTEAWRKTLAANGFKVVEDPDDDDCNDGTDTTEKNNKLKECQACGKMVPDTQSGMCPHCAPDFLPGI